MPGPAELCAGHDWLACNLEHLDERDRPAMALTQRVVRGLAELVPAYDPHERAFVSYNSLAADAGVSPSQLHSLRHGRTWLQVNTLGRICFAADLPLS